MDDSSTKIEFYQQCVELTDFVLEGYKNQLQSLTENQDRQKAVLKMYEFILVIFVDYWPFLATFGPFWLLLANILAIFGHF